MLQEKQSSKDRPEVIQKIITFFAEVFVKFIYIRSNYPTLNMNRSDAGML